MSRAGHSFPVASGGRPITGLEDVSAGSRSRTLFLILMAIALIVRVVLFNGPIGSDDVVYFAKAVEISNGIWTPGDYNGSLRYGFNLPAAFFVYLFGENFFAANLWPLICSLAEVAAVYWFGRRFFGEKVGFFAAVIIAALPLHVAAATRIHTDAIVSLMLTLAFMLLYVGHESGRWKLFFWSGVAVGAVFWVKELAAVTFFAFLVFPLLWRRLELGWIAFVAGALLMLALHFLLMYVLAGDPFHLFRVVLSAVKGNFIDKQDGEDSALFYFNYLLFKIQHTGLVGIWCLFAIVMFPWLAGKVKPRQASATLFVIVWFLSLLVVLSFFPVSLSPLRLAMKQSNYLTLVLAPLCLLAAMFMARLPTRLGRILLGATVVVGLALSVLEQADLRVFGANSKAAVEFVDRNPKANFVGSTNNSNFSVYLPIRDTGRDGLAPIATFAEWLPQNRDKPGSKPYDPGLPLFAIIDRQTMHWMARGAAVSQPLPCWSEVAQLQPTGFGLSKNAIDAALVVLQRIPVGALQPIRTKLESLSSPEPATVYRVEGSDLWCGAKS